MSVARRLTNTDFQALADFRYELRRFLRFSEDAAKSQGLRPLQYQLLLQIKGLPRPKLPTVGELATRLQIAQHGMVTLISRCEKAGLVERVAGKHDRRVTCVRLTPEGERAVRRVAQLHLDELWSMSKVLRLAHLSTRGNLERYDHKH
jgi:DNA-binding MarR family transcriptional regulator